MRRRRRVKDLILKLDSAMRRSLRGVEYILSKKKVQILEKNMITFILIVMMIRLFIT